MGPQNCGVEANAWRWYHLNYGQPSVSKYHKLMCDQRVCSRWMQTQMVIYVAAELSRDNYSYSYAEINWERCGR